MRPRRTHARRTVARVPICLLVRHGRTTANTSGTLAGWTRGVGLDDRPQPGRGARQAAQRRCRSRRWSAARCSAASETRPSSPTPLGALSRDTVRGPGGVPLRRLDRSCAQGPGPGPAVAGGAGPPERRAFPRQRGVASRSPRCSCGRCARSGRRTPRSPGPRPRRPVGGGVARRRDQVGARRRGRRAPGPVPADPGRPGLAVGRALHRPRPFVVRVNDAGVDLAGLVPPPPSPPRPARPGTQRPGGGPRRTPSLEPGDAPVGGGAGTAD